MRRQAWWIAGLLPLFLWPGGSWGHDAPLDAYGCHANKTRFGNTTSRECHIGLLAGNTYTSISAEYQGYIQAQALIIGAINTELKAINAKLDALPPPTPCPPCPTCPVCPTTGSLTLRWDANTEPDLAGYRSYCGTAPGDYSLVRVVPMTVTTVTYTDLPGGATYRCVLTAYDTGGLESGYSNEVQKVIP